MEEASEDSNASSRRSLKRKSNDIGWEYGELCDPNDLNAVRCKLCGHVCRGGVYRIKQHIAHYKTTVKKCPLSSAEDKRRCLEALLGGKNGANWFGVVKRVKEEAGLRNEVSCSIVREERFDFDVDGVQTSGPSRVGKRGPMDRYVCKNIEAGNVFDKRSVEAVDDTHKQKECLDDVHEQVARWVYEAGIPFDAIEHPSFLAFCEALGRYGRGYRPPSQYQLFGPLLKEEVERIKESLKKHEQEWKYTGCSVIVDAWTDSKQRSIMNICVNSRMGTTFLSRDDSEEALTGEYIADYVNKCIDEVGEEKVVQIVTDNDSNNMAAAKLVLERRPKLFWSTCATHTINVILKGISKLPQFDGIISKAKNLAIFLRAHCRTLAMMCRITLKRDIVKPGVTKFATTFLTLQSLFEKKGKLMLMFSADDWSMCKLSSSCKGREASAIVLSFKFWEGVNRCLKVFGPLVKVLRLGNKPSMGFIVGELENAKKEIKALYKNKQEKCKPILDIIEENSKDRLDTPLHKAAYLLNPHYYYNDPNMRMDSDLQKAALACIEKFFMDDPETMKLVQNVELVKYMHCRDWFDKVGAVGGAKMSMDPVHWWSNWGLETVNLQNMAMRILSLTASASGCERNWSTFDGKRNRLEASRMDDLVFVQFNSKLSIKNKRAKENGDVLITHDATNAQGWTVENGDINEEDSLVPGNVLCGVVGEAASKDLDKSSDGEPVEEVGFADSDEDRVMLFEESDDDGPWCDE